MRVVTEAMVRSELKAAKSQVYYLPEGAMLSPAAKEYLQQYKFAVKSEKERLEMVEEKRKEIEITKTQTTNEKTEKPKYEDYQTGAAYFQKPEHMTQLFGKLLVDKDHPRIKFRGKLDSLQAEVVFAQAQISKESGSKRLLKDLQDVLDSLREIMKCEVLEMEFEKTTIIGLTHEELRKQSHNPMKYYNIKQLLPAEYTMGTEYARLNLLRASVREGEVLAVNAFKTGRKIERSELIEELNRLSSALHIMMCRYLAGEYRNS